MEDCIRIREGDWVQFRCADPNNDKRDGTYCHVDQVSSLSSFVRFNDF